jgi:putative phosphoesterase
MIRIGVISDTHIPSKAKALPQVVLDGLQDTDYIFHLGDISELSVIETLEKLAPVYAVAGNTDGDALRRRFGEKRLVCLGSKTFGLVHGHGEKGKTPDRARTSFKDENPDCIVFGHSHIPYSHYDNGLLLFNSGSPTDKRRNDFYSYGILEVGPEIVPKLIFFDKQGVIRQL